MGAQDSRETWVELPFWRLMTYYVLCGFAGSIIGSIVATISLCLFYPPLQEVISKAIFTFLTGMYWWVAPSTMGILFLIIYIRYKTNRKLEVKTKYER